MISFVGSSSVVRIPRCSGWFLLAVLLLLQVGCESKDAAPPPRVVDDSPQAKFERVVAELRRGLDTSLDSGGGRYTFSDTDGAGSTVFSYEIEAPETISKPAPGELPRATIKITQVSSYSSLTSSQDDEEEGDKDKQESNNKDSRRSTEAQQSELESMGYEVLDPALVEKDFAKGAAPRLRAPDFSTRTITTDTQVVYELVFENNRWRMAAPPAADAPESTNIALDLALKRQNSAR